VPGKIETEDKLDSFLVMRTWMPALWVALCWKWRRSCYTTQVSMN